MLLPVWLNILMQWIHLSAIAIALGGAFYSYFVLLPALQTLPDPEKKLLLEKTQSQFRRVVWTCVLLITISGLVNFIKVHPVLFTPSLKRTLLLTKVVLVLILVGILTILNTSFSWVKPFQAKRKQWLMTNILLAIAIIGLSVWLKRI
jgi:uncharacterized membrane protein